MNVKEPRAVILVHGLWMHGVAFGTYRYRLARSGFFVRTFSYPTIHRGLDANSSALSSFLSGNGYASIDLVGHSLGGLVILNMLATCPDPRIRRVILMGTPCRGSHCASVLLEKPGLSWIVGKAIRDAQQRANWPVPEHVELGVLAGNRSFGLGRVIPNLPLPNDGTVSVEETRLDGCKDAITLPVSHSEMLFSRSCTDQIIHFLNTGCFLHV